MRLHLATAPAAEPLSLAEAKAHLRVDGSDEDSLITDLIKAARETFEQETGRQVITATWRGSMDRFPLQSERIHFPKPPLASVTSVTYLDSNGASDTWDSSEYTVDTFSGPFALQGVLYPKPDEDYPDTYPVPNAVTLNFTAGYGSSASDVPEGVRAAIKGILGELFEEREGVITGTIVRENPAIVRVLNRFRVPAYA